MSKSSTITRRSPANKIAIPLRVTAHPGEILREEFIKPLGLTQGALAEKLGMSRVAVNEIVNGRRSVTPATALRLAKALGTTPEFWLNGQLAVDLYKAEHDEEQLRAVAQITPIRCSA